MALTVETGSGSPSSDAYISLDDHSAFLAARYPDESAAWDATTASAKEALIRRATSFIDTYSFVGEIDSDDQALAWPREGAIDNLGREIDSGTVPTCVKHATSEAVRLLVAGETLSPTLSRGGKVKQETVGPLSVTYADSAPSRSAYYSITDTLGPVLVKRRRVVRV